MNNSNSLLDIYKLRYEWANESFRSFISQFDPDLYPQYLRTDAKEQISVVVYGPSQVGKTSFILELLGVKQTNIKQVQEVLRGGKASGRSSTATATRYHISVDNLWHIKLKDDSSENIQSLGKFTHLDAKQATEKIGEIRNRMETEGKRFPVTEIDIYIPNSYIDKLTFDNYDDKDIVIRDLPGVNAENKKEQEYVINSIAKKINIADIVILMSKIDDLNKLINNEYLHADKFSTLENWWFKPMKFKAVFTGSFSNQSIKTFIEENKNQNLNIELRKHLLQQIQRFDGGLVLDSSQLFLLEVGDSWQNLSTALNTNYFKITENLKKDYFDELKQTILLSNNPINRLRYGYQIGEVAKAILKKEQLHFKSEVKEIEKNLAWLQEKIRSLIESIEQYETNLEQLTKQFDKQKNSFNQLLDKNNKAIEGINSNRQNKAKNLKKTVGSLKSYISNSFQDLENIYLLELSENKKLQEHEDVIVAYKLLDSYFLDDYWSDDNFYKDLNKINNALNNQSISVRTEIFKKYNDEINKVKKSYTDKKSIVQSGIQQHKNQIPIYENQIANNKSKKDLLQNQMELFKAERQREIEYSENFGSFMFAESKKYITIYSDNARQEVDFKRKFLWLLLISQIKQDMDKVK